MKRPKLPMFWATAAVVAFGLVVAALSVWLLGLIVFGPLPGTWTPGPAAAGTEMTWLDPVKVALTVAAGIGGAVALVVAYRKQRMAERQELEAAYVAAAAQLGDASPTVRLAGVYAMANLADSWPDRQQQCVDVLCAYLRVPWNSTPDADHPLATKTIESASRGTKRVYLYPNDRGELEVRNTILRVIGDHLKLTPGGPAWTDLGLDFTGAHLPELVWINKSIGSSITFEGATFAGSALFIDTAFHGLSWFEGATFAGEALFSGVRWGDFVSFDRSNFDADVSFEGAAFSGECSFDGASFAGDARFDRAKFNDGFRRSVGTRLDGAAIFSKAVFKGMTSFCSATFNGDAKFDQARFDEQPQFEGARFVGEVSPDRLVPE